MQQTPMDLESLGFGLALFTPSAYGMLLHLGILTETSITMYGKPAVNKIGVAIYMVGTTIFLGFLLLHSSEKLGNVFLPIFGLLFVVYVYMSVRILFFDKEGRLA